jgi:hypothetical protein
MNSPEVPYFEGRRFDFPGAPSITLIFSVFPSHAQTHEVGVCYARELPFLRPQPHYSCDLTNAEDFAERFSGEIVGPPVVSPRDQGLDLDF